MNRRIALGLLYGVLAAGCDKQIPQDVIGTLSSATAPMANVQLRLYSSFKECKGEYLDAYTNADGVFRFRTQSTRGGLRVVLQHLALCSKQSDEWRPLWSRVTGGGATRIDLVCRPPLTIDDEFCDITVEYGNPDA